MNLRKIVYSITFFALLFMNCSDQVHENFTVSGSKLIDANGNPFMIRGVNNPHIWYLKGPYESLDTLADQKVNCVRIVWETRGKVDSLERAVSRCIELDMIPMVELHDATGDTSLSSLLELTGYYTRNDVSAMLKKYEKYLLLNIANEWGDHSTTSEKWEEYYRQAVDSLRKAGYRCTIVIDAPGWGQNLQPVFDYGKVLLEKDPLHNLLFSVHMYGSWNDARKISEQLKKAHESGLPLIVGEFGYNYNEGENNLGCRVDHRVILKTCQELGYGYLAWSWTGNNAVNAWLDMAEFNDWTTLTWWGKEVIDGEHGIKATSQKASVFQQ